jgi:hypothetical protein
MGTVGSTSAGNVYALAEGRIGTIGQLISETINSRSVPWIWSVVEFDSSGNPINVQNDNNYATFPTYFIYINGQIYAQVPQGQLEDFTTLNSSSQLTPSQIQ